MNRVIVIRLPSGEERILACFLLKPGGYCGVVEATFPSATQMQILHPRLEGNMLVFQSSTNIEHLRFSPLWNIEWNEQQCRVVHGQDLLDKVQQNILRSGPE